MGVGIGTVIVAINKLFPRWSGSQSGGERIFAALLFPSTRAGL